MSINTKNICCIFGHCRQVETLKNLYNGAMTFSIMTLTIKDLYVTLSVSDSQDNNALLSVITLSAFMLSDMVPL
jgi:hypothetical protein